MAVAVGIVGCGTTALVVGAGATVVAIGAVVVAGAVVTVTVDVSVDVPPPAHADKTAQPTAAANTVDVLAYLIASHLPRSRDE